MFVQQVVIEYLQLASQEFNYILAYFITELFEHFVLFEHSFKICLVV